MSIHYLHMLGYQKPHLTSKFLVAGNPNLEKDTGPPCCLFMTYCNVHHEEADENYYQIVYQLMSLAYVASSDWF